MSFLFLLQMFLEKSEISKFYKWIVKPTNAVSQQAKQIKRLPTSFPLKDQIKHLAPITQITSTQVAKLFLQTPKNLINQIKTNPAAVSKKLGEMTTDERRIVGLAVQQQAEGTGIDTATLSSSWLVMGVYEPVGFIGSGFLTLTTKEGHSYRYPGVSIYVWEAMKAATGQNGSGAGSVFWALYLRGYKASTGGAITSQAFKTIGLA